MFTYPVVVYMITGDLLTKAIYERNNGTILSQINTFVLEEFSEYSIKKDNKNIYTGSYQNIKFELRLMLDNAQRPLKCGLIIYYPVNDKTEVHYKTFMLCVSYASLTKESHFKALVKKMLTIFEKIHVYLTGKLEEFTSTNPETDTNQS